MKTYQKGGPRRIAWHVRCVYSSLHGRRCYIHERQFGGGKRIFLDQHIDVSWCVYAGIQCSYNTIAVGFYQSARRRCPSVFTRTRDESPHFTVYNLFGQADESKAQYCKGARTVNAKGYFGIGC